MYEKRSRTTLTSQKKSTKELKFEAFKTYMISTANTSDKLASLRESFPINQVSKAFFLSIWLCTISSLFQQQMNRNLQVDRLKDLSRLLKLVTEQEKKYKYRLSLNSNFYYCHLIVQQFLHLQLNIYLSPTRFTCSIQATQAFSLRESIARSIVR